MPRDAPRLTKTSKASVYHRAASAKESSAVRRLDEIARRIVIRSFLLNL